MPKPTPRDWLLLFALVAMWGSSFMFTKIAVATIPPVTLVAARLVLGAVFLLILVYASGRRLPRSGRNWAFFFALAIAGSSLPFFLISWGQQRIDSALAGILMAIMPLTTLVLAHFFIAAERMSARKITGFVLGFSGIVVLMGPKALLEIGGADGALLSELAVLGGAVCYAINTIIARRQPKNDALVIATGVALSASLISTPIAVFDQPWSIAPSPASLLALVALGIVSTALATVVYFKLVASAGATFVSLINYLIPLWAVALGTLFLGEQPDWNALLALLMILSGIALSQFARR